MPRCDTCGNDYPNTFEVTMNGQTNTFDCFECAIQKCAPTCAHCGCKVIGHGVDSEKGLFCCANCAHQAGAIRIAA